MNIIIIIIKYDSMIIFFRIKNFSQIIMLKFKLRFGRPLAWRLYCQFGPAGGGGVGNFRETASVPNSGGNEVRDKWKLLWKSKKIRLRADCVAKFWIWNCDSRRTTRWCCAANQQSTPSRTCSWTNCIQSRAGLEYVENGNQAQTISHVIPGNECAFENTFLA